ncbi:ATP-grasp domain-containing protein [Paracoccus aerodenitrificans]|uniref:ATP-grasp domain-containing protein n=1 Tax=Paracoccus aerodenitrificans TaxID=3017781 RepID=UPI0022F060A9|nr:ATP-grasp domain-containing protein [Paracoccus aerodenitrificans]WBU63468.1 ATP-grasp domain-containing protein [Paracoccus aerodenitrificans]
MTDRAVIPVLISSAGRRGALVKLFRQAGGDTSRVVVHGCDMRPELSSACLLADHTHQVPRCSDPGFIDRIEEIVRQNAIRLIVPTIDTELAVYAQAAGRLEAAGARVHVSPPDVIRVARDKMRTMKVLAASGVDVPPTCSEAELRGNPSALGWPVFGKPVGGSASRGLGIYRSERDLPDSFPEPMMFQPVLSGPEYTVNIFIDASGALRCAVPHLRIQIRAGEVEKGRTVRKESLRLLAESVQAALPDARGVLCFQVIDDPQRGPKIIEINARFGGGYPLAHHAGGRFADWLIEELTGQVSTANDDWRDAVTMLRYDDAVFAG